MKLFRTGLSPHHTALAMIGVKPGAAALVIGAGDPALAAALALITGLNGRTVVVSGNADDAALVKIAADKAGALVDFEPLTANRLPFDAETFDAVVLQRQLGSHADANRSIVDDAVRVVRSGGRMIAIEGDVRTGLLASMWRSSAPPPDGTAIASRLTQARLVAVRVLGESDGVVYVEGRKT